MFSLTYPAVKPLYACLLLAVSPSAHIHIRTYVCVSHKLPKSLKGLMCILAYLFTHLLIYSTPFWHKRQKFIFYAKVFVPKAFPTHMSLITFMHERRNRAEGTTDRKKGFGNYKTTKLPLNASSGFYSKRGKN